MQERVAQFLAAAVNFTSVAVFLEDIVKPEKVPAWFHLNVADR